MKKLFSNALLICLVLILASCEKENKDSTDNFDGFAGQFAEPGKQYRTAPLYVWNTKVTPELIDATLTQLKERGFGGVFVHPRPGLVTEYISDEWYSLFRHALDKGKELDMNVWIYDENSYPSGFAGGHVPAEMPESYNQGQGLVMEKTETLPDDTDKYYLLLKRENDKFTDITADIAAAKGQKGDYYLFSKTYQRNSAWHGGFSYVDLLYPGVTEKFIEITMPGYERVAGDEFGKSMPGWFTDEPNIHTTGGIRWTPDLFEVFEKEWGYKLQENLPSLFEETDNWKQVRHNYTQTLLQMFIDRWAKPCFEYCEEKNLKFTGHYWEHGWPDMGHGGDNMAMYAWHQLPAIDMLFNQFNEESPQAQFGNVRAVKELSSVANQMGYKRTLSETYGGAGWEETFNDFKRLGDWEYALGVNFMNQHLSHLSISGARKYDYPPTFSEHSPWWKYYKQLNMHYARLSMALSAGEQINDVLILEPTTSIWMYYSYTNGNNRLWDIGRAFQTFVTTLEKAQVEYDLGSENIIKDQGKITDNKFTIGKRGYSRVVIPPLTDNLNTPTFELLKQFAAQGGKIFAFGKPAYKDGSPDEEIKAFFESNKVIALNELKPSMYQNEFASDITFNVTRPANLFHHRRIVDDGQIVFLANSSPDETASGSILLKGKDAIELQTLTGEIVDYPESANGELIEIKYELPPVGSLLLYVANKKQSGIKVREKPQNFTALSTANTITAKPESPNMLTIDFCDLQLGKETFKDLYTYHAADKVYKTNGFPDGNPWNTSVQYKDHTVRRDTFTTGGFKATYKFTIENDFDLSSLKAVVERPHLYTVTLNGTEIKPGNEWWLDRDMKVFSIGNLAKKGENTLSLETPVMKIHAEIEPVYILGNFTVEPADKGWKILPPATTFHTGSWKAQGFPFYAGTVSYSKDYNLSDLSKFYQVRLGEWKGTVSEVVVNGKSAGIIAFEPSTLDVSDFIKERNNTVEVKIVGSNKNLLGPFHRNPEAGVVSPWHFRNAGAYPSGREYQQLDYGLFGDIILESANN